MIGKASITRASVLLAVAECDVLGREAFLDRHGYRRGRYVVEHGGRAYDSKALIGVAYGYEHGCRPLVSSSFSGGREHAVKVLGRLGFVVSVETLGSRLVECARSLLARARLTVASMSAELRVLLVGLVSCSKAKLDRAAPARELYSASYVFERSARYVERLCDEWWVLSAKHGLVAPDTVLEPYDETLMGARTSTRKAWAQSVRDELRRRYGDRPVRFVLMAGRSYAGAVEGFDSDEPLAGLGTGHRRQWLAQHT